MIDTGEGSCFVDRRGLMGDLHNLINLLDSATDSKLAHACMHALHMTLLVVN
jgi:hypothetical protein